MKTIGELMRPVRVWVHPRHTVQTALILLKGYGLLGLPVMEGERLAGVVEYANLLHAAPEQTIAEVMRADFPCASPEAGVKQVAEQMARNQFTLLPVKEGEQLVGFVTVFELLPEIGRSYDPLTGLPWSDTLREWSMEKLASGEEITILFFDMDQFGAFNKRYGHVVGDEVLRRVAEIFQKEIDLEIEIGCRYGGDEFAIATLRRSEEAGLLAHHISRLVSALRLPEVEIPLAISYGYHGGKRTREREQVHYAATVDNLINLASRECMKMKSVGQAGAQLTLPIPTPPEPSKPSEKRVQIQSFSFVKEGKRARARVYLRIAETSVSGVAEGDQEALSLAAQAVLQALHRLLPPAHQLSLVQVAQSEPLEGRSLIHVILEWHNPSGKKELVGSALVSADPYHATAAAVLDALNRPLTHLLVLPQK